MQLNSPDGLKILNMAMMQLVAICQCVTDIMFGIVILMITLVMISMLTFAAGDGDDDDTSLF